MVTVESVAHGIAQIAQQVEPVGHLDLLRSAGANAVGKGAGLVAGDDLDAGMILQPGGAGRGTAVGQQIDRPVGTLEIDDNGAATPAAAPGPVIDADKTRAGGAGSTGTARIRRSRVSPLTGMASRLARRDHSLPPAPSDWERWTSASRTVRRLRKGTAADRRSAKIRHEQSDCRQ
jgi:hypothetical protein